MNTRLPVGERLRVWELTTDRITGVSPWVTVKGVRTRTATVQLVCHWFTVKGVGTHDRQDYTVGLRLKVWEHEPLPFHWFVTGLRL